MHGAVQFLYAAFETGVRVSGELTVCVNDGAHLSNTSVPMAAPLVCTNATCVPSPEMVGDVRIWPPVL
jgi:hypothetical protein